MEEEQASYLLKISTNLFLASNSEGMVTYASPKAVLLFGFPELSGFQLSDILPLKIWQPLNKHIESVFTEKTPNVLTLLYQNCTFNIYFYFFNDQALQCWEDITERKQLSAALHRTAERLEFAERTTRLGYWEMDFNGRKLYWSAEMYRIFGLKAADISHKRNIIREHILTEDYPIYKEKLHELVSTGHPVDGILRLRRADNEIIYCAFKASYLWENGKHKIAGTFQDLTQLFKMQKDLDDARQAAESSNRAKSYFLAQASHDLRQPMQALKIFISTLKEEHLSSHQMQLVDKISASADNLNNLLDNLLDLSKLDSNGFEVNCYGFDISDLLKNIIFEFQEIARDKKITFHPSLCHYTVNSDPILVERVIRNLLSNAFKYTRNKILLGCKRENKYIRILIMDNGRGISPSETEQIFDEFFQSDKIIDNKKKGAGLGLSIVKRISEILDLDIKVTSVEGKGSCFSFQLPFIRTPR